MSKRIVVGLDPSDYSRTATEVACVRAKIYEGTVVGVGVVDLPGIERSSSGAGVGASHYAKKARERHIREAERTVEELLEAFRATCAEHGVRCETEYKAGDPAEEIADAGTSADLVILGTRTFFHFETDKGAGDTIQEVLRERACPVLAVPRALSLPLDLAIFPYDGSVKAAHAMREFVTLTSSLPIAPNVLLLRIDEDVDEGMADLARPSQYLEAYGYQVGKKVLPGEAKETILEVALEHQPAVVVLGSSGKGALRSFLFGSVTRTLLENGTIPMFVAG